MEANRVSCGATAKRKGTGRAGASPGRYRAGGQLAAVCCTRRRAPWSTAACAVVAAAEGGRVASRYPPPPRAPVGQPCGESGRALQRQQRVPVRGQRGLLGRSSARRAIPKRASACARAHGRSIRPVQPRSRPGHGRGGGLPPHSASVPMRCQPAPIRRSTRDPRGGRVARAQGLVRVCERDGVRGNWATLTRPTGCAHIVVWAPPRTAGQHRGRFVRRSSRTQRRPHRDLRDRSGALPSHHGLSRVKVAPQPCHPRRLCCFLGLGRRDIVEVSTCDVLSR